MEVGLTLTVAKYHVARWLGVLPSRGLGAGVVRGTPAPSMEWPPEGTRSAAQRKLAERGRRPTS